MKTTTVKATAIVSTNVELNVIDQYALRERIDRVEQVMSKLLECRVYYEKLNSIPWKERESSQVKDLEPKVSEAFKAASKAIWNDESLRNARVDLCNLLIFLDKCAPKALATSNVFYDAAHADEC